MHRCPIAKGAAKINEIFKCQELFFNIFKEDQSKANKNSQKEEL